MEQQKLLSRKKRDFLDVPAGLWDNQKPEPADLWSYQKREQADLWNYKNLETHYRRATGHGEASLYFNDQLYSKMWYYVSSLCAK